MLTMEIFLALIAPDGAPATVLGVYSSLELAQAAFPAEGDWVFIPRYRQYWQNDRRGLPSDDEIHPLTLDRGQA
jgi:hypothetical protein